MREERDQLLSIVRGMMGSHLARVLEAEDVLQEAALAAHERCHTLKETRVAGLRSWLLRIAQLRILEYSARWAKKARPRRGASLPPTLVGSAALEELSQLPAPEGDDPARAAADTAPRSVTRHVWKLRRERRATLLLHGYFGSSWETIAFLMERTPQAVRKLHDRTRHSLRALPES